MTYRGVAIGRVGALHLIDKGIQVDLNIDNCKSAKVPNDSAATVSDRSVIGEQYVNLIPPPDWEGSRFRLHGGEVIPLSRTYDPGGTAGTARQLRARVRRIRSTRTSCASSITELADSRRSTDRGPAISASCSIRRITTC